MSVIEVKPFYVYTPLGDAVVKFLDTENTAEFTCLVGVFQEETKEFWWWPNHMVRIAESVSAKRDASHSPIYVSGEWLASFSEHIMRHKGSPFHWRVSDKNVKT